MKTETGKRALRAVLVLLSLGLLLALIAFVVRPPCLILERPGYYCTGCGTQRMLYALLRGDFSSAFGENPFMFIFLPAAGVYCVMEAVLYVKQKRPLYKSRRFVPIVLVLFAAAVLFMALRNLPGFEFLGPR